MKTNRFITFFLLKAIALYAIWYLVYDLWLKKVGALDNLIIDNLVYLADAFLTFFGYHVNVDYHKMWVDGAAGSVIVGSGCNALELFALFTGFILIFEGSWKNKLWFIPTGIIIIHLFNVLRVVALTLNGISSIETLRFNHKYTFTIIMYCFTFLGWMIWVKFFAKKSNDKNEEESQG
jgi:exosortase family protein XrtF